MKIVLFASCFLIGTVFFFFYRLPIEKAPVKLGVVLPLTGEYKSYGEAALRGLLMAVHDVNNSGGVLNGKRLELVVKDNKTQPGASVRLTRELIQKENVLAIFGPVSSASRNAMTEVLEQFRTPQFYGIDYEGGVPNKWLFCYSPIPDHYIKPLVPYMFENYGKSFYVFGYDYIWPHNIAKVVEREVEALGGRVVGLEFTPFGIQDFSQVLQRIKESEAENLILILPGNDGIKFIRQFNAAGMKRAQQMAALASDEMYIKRLSAKELEGIISPLHFVSSLTTPEATRFVKKARSLFGEQTVVTYASEAHYGLVLMLTEAIEKVGALDKEKIVEAMTNVEVIVGNGLVQMRSDHNVNMNMLLAQFKGGKLDVIKDFGLISPSDQRTR
ncbi:substrate-binding protein [Pseudodesulfovibrio sp.]|nr:substrate-binding protein [Pseudodesulfovibrio sp.]